MKVEHWKPETIYEWKTHVLGLCGCTDEEFVDDCMRVLRETCMGDFYITDIVKRTDFEYNYVLAILCILSEAGLVEHGTAIRGSWATEKGRQVTIAICRRKYPPMEVNHDPREDLK